MITSLNSFRFFTALAIFLFHASSNFLLTEDFWIKKIFDGGTIFMSGFFVLSGFILSHIYHNKDFNNNKNLFDFYFKRLARIYPIYILVTILYFVFIPRISYQEKIFYIINDIFLLQGFFENLIKFGINNTTWSVSVEAFLYLTFPLIILISKNRLALFIFSIILAIFSSLNFSVLKENYIYANPFFRLSDFIFGILCYLYKDFFIKLNYQKLIHLATISLIILICFVSKENRMSFQIFTIPLFGIWIISAFYSKSLFYNNSITNYLGLISYSFYLWQTSAVGLTKEIIKNYQQASPLLVIIICLIINLILSILSYHFIEQKSRKYFLSKTKIFLDSAR